MIFRKAQIYARNNNKGLWDFKKKKEWEKNINKAIQLAKTCGKNGTICVKDVFKYKGQYKTVRFFVRKSYDSGKAIFLNSHINYQDPNNFMVVIFDSYKDKFPPDPADFYWDKTIDVTGKIREYKGKLEIIVEDPIQIEILK